jgi:hypothetical protein
VDFSGEKPETPLLDTVNYPVHMKNLSDGGQGAAAADADTPPFLFFFPHLSPQRGVVVESERASYTSFLQRSS